jgi:signal transduction histidine kinase
MAMGSHVTRPTRRVDRDLEAIGALTQAVLDGDDLEQLLARIAREARALVDGACGVVVTVTDETREMTFRAVDGLSVGPLRVGHTMGVHDTLTELAVERGLNIVARDATEIPSAGRAFAAATGMGPLIAAPLAELGAARGVLLVARLDGTHPFRPADVRLISTFASQAASAIQLFDLRAAENETAVLVERTRIARDLHERVVDALAELVVSVRVLADGTSDRRVAAGMAATVAQLEEALTTVRTYVADLTPAAAASTVEATQSQSDRPAPRRRQSPTPDARRSTDTIEAIGRLARASAAGGPVEEVLGGLATSILERASAAWVLVGTVTDHPGQVRVRASAGTRIEGRQVGDVAAIGETLAGEAIALGRPLVRTGPADRPTLPLPGMEFPDALVVVPLVVRGRAFGALAIGRAPGAPRFSRADVRLIEAYAVHAATALEFDRVREELRLGSVSAERDRIGRDLHERVIQVLFGVALALEALASTVRDAGTRQSVRATVDALDRVIRDLRRHVFDLGPAPSSETAGDEELVALAADNARLQAEVTAQLDEVRASRSRIVAAGDAERRRVERDLHDGAQQRLVSLTLALRLARTRLGDDVDPAAQRSLEQASDDARAALTELRQLARGIHPQILTEAGLRPAIQSLADRSPLEVSVDVVGERFSPAVEGTAYFTISEALANVAKHAQATRAAVTARRSDGHLAVLIADDGVGGASMAAGTGLRGLLDRLAAIDGTLEVRSPSGEGTRVVARIPAAHVPVAEA